MFRHCFREDEDVIKVDADNPFRYHVMEDVSHHRLECGRTVVGVECGLPLVSLTDPNIVETPADIQLSEVPCPTELCDQFGNEWNGVPVVDRDHIQGPVILHKSERAILLLDEEHRRCHG
ncbi:hypothetical protein JB92DRAFT_2897395 [Gautieria morchelliformis]|nr:hypothetical protein JB92DRAFT_2897395 [Gautieria morchelliformis]